MKSLLFAFACIWICVPAPVYAAQLDISDGHPDRIRSEEDTYEATAHLTIHQPDGTQYYLRGVFFTPGSSNYCGKTWNGSTWYAGPFSSDGYTHLPIITLSSGSGSLAIRAKIDRSDSGCRANGEYQFKIQRYTHTGSGSFDTQDVKTVYVDIPDAEPTKEKPSPTRIPAVTLPPPTVTDEPLPSEEEVPGEEELIKEVVPSLHISPLIGRESDVEISTPASSVAEASDSSKGRGIIWVMIGVGIASVLAGVVGAFRVHASYGV